MRFSIVDRRDLNSINRRNQFIEELEQNGFVYDETNPEIVICVGGDGTILRAIHEYINVLDTTMFVGIHTGTLGFLTDFTQDEIQTLIQKIVCTKPSIEERPLLEIELDNNKIYAFNELRISSMERTLALNVFIDGESFEKTCGSGLCISTQAGSSALNRALNGAVVDSGIDVIQLCEIMPISSKNHHSLMNPYIMREDRKITIVGDALKYANINYDHLKYQNNGLSEVKISTSIKKVRFARYRTYSYLERLRNLY